MAKEIKVVELFAGVGGFRLGLDGYHDPNNEEFNKPPAGNFHTIWANNWEPNGRPTKQFAWRCYEKRFGEGSCVNEDIAIVVEQIKNGERELPEFDMLVGGFPCQDYSVAKPASMASGIDGKKGVLWWSINSILEMRHPKRVLLENVDRLLKSPTAQRGRDFAIILSCLYRLGYSVEWRVINAADYGMPQRRRRVYIYAEHDAPTWNLHERLFRTGVEARAFPIKMDSRNDGESFNISSDPYESTQSFGRGRQGFPLQGSWRHAERQGNDLPSRTGVRRRVSHNRRHTRTRIGSPRGVLHHRGQPQDVGIPQGRETRGSHREERPRVHLL